MGPISWLRAALRRRYPRDVGPSRKHRRLEPVRHLPELDQYAGLWVAVKDGKVRERARTSVELAEILFRKNIQGATIQFVPPPSDSEKVGLG